MQSDSSTVAPGYCACGCGSETTIYRGVPRAFVVGHSRRGKPWKGPSLDERVWARVDKSGVCWIWTGGRFRDKNGRETYGAMSMGGRWHHAHRVVWMLVRGPIPDGLWVLHNCPGGDNKLCVNPDHLYLGTVRDNVDDAMRKGQLLTGDKSPMHLHPEKASHGDAHWTRQEPAKVARGERQGQAKLTEMAVRDIDSRYRAGGVSLSQLGREYGVHLSTIWLALKRRNWKHV